LAIRPCLAGRIANPSYGDGHPSLNHAEETGLFIRASFIRHPFFIISFE
jgi:hypothetical protein